MTTTLYGVPASRAARCLWALEEIGQPYELVKEINDGDKPKPAFVAANPNAKMPALVDGDVKLFESLAINTYLAKKAGGDLAPKTLAEDAATQQWSLWAMTETEANLLKALFHQLGIFGHPKDPAVVAECAKALDKPLKVLDAHLGKQPWLVGDRFTIADLNVASVLSWAKGAKLDLSAYPNLSKWLDTCLGRPAFGKVREMQKAG
jgi:glutathione S-transferase